MRPDLRKFAVWGITVVLVLLNLGCGQPVFESASCLAARDPVKRLYSLHMDGGPNPKGAKLEKLRSFLSVGLFKELSAGNDVATDYLTQSAEFPKAFRVGTCREAGSGPEFDVLLFWRSEDISTEQTIVVSAKKENDWVVNSVRK